MKQKLLDILREERIDDIIPFLKSLTKEERSKLSPTIKEQIKYYSTYTHKKGYSRINGTYTQFAIASIASFVCFNFADYKRNRIQLSYLSSGFIKFHEYSQQELIARISIDDVLEWYHPDWMSEFINSNRTNPEWKGFTYEQIMRWYHKGYITLSPELIVNTLPAHPFIFIRNEKPMRYIMRPEKLLQYPETLSEHIWLLFAYPTLIHYNIYYNLEHEDDNWNKIFRWLVSEGRIDRLRVLKECLHTATNSNFNKPQTGWFAELFTNVQPHPEELLSLQAELLQSLTSTQSKPINNALNCIKTICTLPQFAVEEFYSYTPALLSSTIKSLVNGTIGIYEKLLKERPECRDRVCVGLIHGFTNADESVQKKIAKLIVKYGRKELLTPHLAEYSQFILSTVKPLLAGFMEVLPETEEFIAQTPDMEVLPLPGLLSAENEIPAITNFDDLLFFAGQAFNNNEPWHIYWLPVYFQQFHAEFTAERVNQLEPVFKQAFKTLNIWNLKIGLADRLCAAFLIDYGKVLNKKFRGASAYLTMLSSLKGPELKRLHKNIGYSESYPFYFILDKTLDCLKSGKHFDILSTPTHTPLWIDPVVLVRRLQIYQQQKKTPYSLDMQQALLRCAPDTTGEALKLAKETLTGEVLDLLTFLFTPEAEAPSKVKHPAWWMCAAMNKQPRTIPVHTKKWGYNSIMPEYFTGNFPWDIQDNGRGIMVLRIKMPIYNVKKHKENTFLPEYHYSMFNSRSLLSGDVERLIEANPHNPDTIIAHYLNRVMDDSSLSITSEKASLIYAVQTLINVRLPLSEMGYLLLAFTLFSPTKEIKDYTAALWTEQVQYGMLDNDKLGKVMGKLLSIQWLPLKRFTDVVENNLMNISSLHNRELGKLLGILIGEIGDVKITNLKKLKELYGECSSNPT